MQLPNKTNKPKSGVHYNPNSDQKWECWYKGNLELQTCTRREARAHMKDIYNRYNSNAA